MRIIDTRKDYYDGVQKNGQDRSVQYVRKSFDEKRKDIFFRPFPLLSSFYGQSHTVSFNHIVIGFCGKIYNLIIVAKEEKRYGSNVNMFKANPYENFEFCEFCYTFEQIMIAFKKVYSAKDFNKYIGKNKTAIYEFFEQTNKEQSKYEKLFIDSRSPIFVVHSPTFKEITIEYNALLGPYNFAKVMHPYQAFQEIYMYLSNFAVPMKPIPTCSDELKAQSKGFNKWSFRTPPVGK